MPLDFENLDELPRIEKIKNCLEQIMLLGDKIGAPIVHLEPNLSKTIQQLSFSMFCYQKQHMKTFTVCDNKKLRRMRIKEDGDDFSEETLELDSFLRDNLLEAFTELVAQSYLLPKPQRTRTIKNLYCASVFSRYSSKEHTLFFTEVDGSLFVFHDKITNILLFDYIKDYFSGRINEKKDDEIETNLQCLLAVVIAYDKTFVERQKKISEQFKIINECIKSRYDFIWGAITFLDFLAWKGMWQSDKENDALKVVSSLIETFKIELNKLTKELFPQAQEIPLSKLISISDTIAIFTPKVSTITECQLIELHTKLSKYILESCIERKYPIRGAIAYGEYNIMNNIMIGPGIDECASWHETGNWIGVHFTPTAQMYWNEEFGENSSNGVIYGYKFHMKNGMSADYCVKWSVDKSIFKELTLKTRALLPEVSTKYTNTYDFLKKNTWEEGKEGVKK